MTAAGLVETLRARGVQLRAVGDRLRVRPADAVTPEEVAALRQHKAAVLALLMAQPPAPRLTLDRATVREVLGQKPDEHDLAILQLDVLAALACLEAEIQTGTISQRPLLVRGRPLADWLGLDDVARLLLQGKAGP